jgi:hypothetical protein
MVLDLWVEPLTKFEDNVGALKIACMINHLVKVVDILIEEIL